MGRFPARIATAALSHGELSFRLRSGIEVRFGDPTDVRLKLAIARRALLLLPPGTTTPGWFLVSINRSTKSRRNGNTNPRTPVR